MKKILSIIIIIALSTIIALGYNASTNLELRLLEATDDVRPFREDFNYNFELVDDIFDTVSLTEYGYLDGVTSAIQTQLNTKLESESDPTVDTKGEIEGILTYGLDDTAGNGDNNKLWSADKIYDQLALHYLKTEIDSKSEMQTIWSLTLPDLTGTPVQYDYGRFTDADTFEGRSYAEMKADLDLEIGTDVQAYSANTAFRTDKLSAFAATTSAELAGVISDETGEGALVFGTAPTFTTSITTPIIYGAGGTYLRIGDAGTTDHGLDSEDDLMVTGDLEIDGKTRHDAEAYFYENAFNYGNVLFADDKSFMFGTGNDAQFRLKVNAANDDHIFVFKNAATNTFVFTNTTSYAGTRDHNLEAQTNPTFYIFSETDVGDAVTTDEYISFIHDQTDAVITTGSGDIILDPAGLNVAIDAPTDNDPGLKFTENSTLKWHIYNDHDDDALQVKAGATLRYEFGADGTAVADVEWGTFSPIVEGEGKELLDIALEDANKPVKPYVGIPVVRSDDELFNVIKEEYQYEYQKLDKDDNLVFDKEGNPIMITATGIREVKIPRDRLPNEFKTQIEVDVEYDKYHKVPAKISIANAKYLEYLTGIIDEMQAKIDNLEARIEALEKGVKPIK